MDTAATECLPYGHTLALHDALPSCARAASPAISSDPRIVLPAMLSSALPTPAPASARPAAVCTIRVAAVRGALLSTCSCMGTICSGRVPLPTIQRSEEHTSELQSLMRISYAVFCLKKKKIQN